MVGITLAAEQIRNAPPEVRRWLEQELLVSFGLRPPSAEAHTTHLTGFSIEDAVNVLSLIQEFIPVVNVFFELGHEGASVGIQGVEAFRLVDILRHTRLQSIEQVIGCLDAINQALCRVRGDTDIVFYGLDGQGFCFIAAQTQRSILQLWQQLVADPDLGRGGLGQLNERSTVSPLGQKAERSGIPAFSQPNGQRAASAPTANTASRPVWSIPSQTRDGSAATRVDAGVDAPGLPPQG